jgi:acyl carrier protein
MKLLLTNLADILDVDAIQPTDTLADFDEWDSLAILSIIAMVDSNYHVNLAASEVKAMPTAEALFGLIQRKRGA